MQRHPSAEEPSTDDHDHANLPVGTLKRLATRAPIVIGVGAAIGVVARYSLTEWSHENMPGLYPIGTFVINLLGCLLIGIVQYLYLEAKTLRRPTQLFLAVGFCGGFTTFSTFSVETLQLIEGDHVMLALAYQLFSVAGGLFAVACGIGIASVGVRVFGRNRSTT